MIGRVAGSISSAVLVGRTAELDRLESALARARAGTPATIVVAGEAGVGKTRLVTAFAGRAEAARAIVLIGACLDVGNGTLPYAPVVEALRSLVTALDPARLEAVLGGARPELARLVPELGPPAPAPHPVTTTPDRLFELVLGVLHRLAAQGPVLFVVEDLHWADRSTRDLLKFLVRNLRAGVVLITTHRTDELHRRHPLRFFLAELERNRRVERLELDPLTRAELATLMAGILGHRPAPRLVTDILARSQGNPFFAEELLAAHAGGVELPPALRDLLLARVDALSEQSQQVLRVAAAGGPRVDHHLLATVAAVSEERLLPLLREAVARNLLVMAEHGDAYSFRHALVQEVLHDDLLPGERRAVHAGYARALAARQADGPADPAELGQLAFHWYSAHETGAALLASIEAGLAAEAAYALAEAGTHYERALELWDAAPEAAGGSRLDRTALLQRAAQAAMLTGDTNRAIALAGLAAAAIDHTAEPLRSAALLERLGRYQWIGGDSKAAMASLQQAVALTPAEPPSWERARALAAHGQLLMLRDRNAEAAAQCEQAIAVARKVGALAEEGNARTSLGVALDALGRTEEGIDQIHEGRRIADELGDPEEVCRADHNLTDILIDNGRAEAGLAQARRNREEANRLGTAQSYGVGAIAQAAEALLMLGRLSEAERLLTEEADLEIPSAGTISRILDQTLLVRALLRLWRGDPATVRTELANVLVHGRGGLDPPFAASVFAILTRAATWEGNLGDARAATIRGLAVLAGCDGKRRVTRVCLAGMEAEAAASELARARRSAEELRESRRVAAELLERIRTATAGHRPGGPAAAELATAEAEWSRIDGSGDPAQWSAAVAAWDAVGYPFPAGYARFRQAEALLAAGVPRSEVAPVLRSAWALAVRLRAGWLEREASALARRARIDLDTEVRPRRGQAAPSPVQQLGLTPREGQVLALVADGRTNQQIAQALYITEKTASVHVSRILAKLGVTNRAEAAAVAHRLRLDR